MVIAHALAMPETGKTPAEEQLIAFLRDQNLLLVLDRQLRPRSSMRRHSSRSC
jgi:hypothetical protein